MNIKQKFFVSIIVSLILVGALGGAIYTLGQEEDAVSERSETAHAILRRVFDLSLLANDYAVGHGERAKVQWQSEYEALLELLQDDHGFDDEDRNLFAQLDDRGQDLNRIFQQLVGNYEGEGYSSVLEDMLLRQLMVELNLMRTTADQLSENIHHDYQHVQWQTSLYGLGFVAAITATLIVTAVVMNRGMVQPLEKLRRGTDVIAEGNLEHRTAIDRDDEIGALSESFDRMAEQLQQSYKTLEERVNKRTHELRERVKEQTCLYGINRLAQRHDLPMDDLFQEVVELIPPGWQYPEVTCARLTVDDATYATDNFEETPWMITQDIIVNGEVIGHIDVGYLEEKPAEAEDVFLEEERYLLDTIATQVGDLIELRIADRKLRESEEKFRSIISNSPIGIALVDQDGKPVMSNEALQDMLGYTAAELEEMPFSAFTHPDDVDKDAKLYRELYEGERDSYSLDKRYIRKDGSVIWGSLTVAVIRDDRGEPVYAVAMVEDITRRKHMERERQELLQDLKRSNEELEQFAYVASHDLQEPLRMVASYTQLLAQRYEGELDEDADEFIAYAVDGANRMKALINDLLQFSRVTTRGKPFEAVDVNMVVENVLDGLKYQIEETDASVTSDDLPTIQADESQLHRVFQNLVSNAIKYRGDEPPEIHVGVEEQQDAWRFAVTDNGIGIDPEHQDRIFVIFQRLHGNDEAGGGTGIGLAITKRIVERHGGRIWVESTPGEGATFYFTIPKELKEKQGEKNE